jgi:hypothetical protein
MRILTMLTGGDSRSLGMTEEVVLKVLKKQSTLEELFSCLKSEDEIVRMRASDALEKVCSQQPEWFIPYIKFLLNEMSKIDQASVQWHLAQMLCEVRLTKAQAGKAIIILLNNLDKSTDWIVENLTLDALAVFVRKGLFEKAQFLKILDKHKASKHRYVVSRVTKLQKEFKNQ